LTFFLCQYCLFKIPNSVHYSKHSQAQKRFASSILEGSESDLSNAEGGGVSKSDLHQKLPAPIIDAAEGPELGCKEESMPESANQPQNSTVNLNVGPKCGTPTTTTIVIHHTIQSNSKPCHIEAQITSQNKMEVVATSNSGWLSMSPANHANIHCTRIIIRDAPPIEDKGQDVPVGVGSWIEEDWNPLQGHWGD
jgi:hypothetical protein